MLLRIPIPLQRRVSSSLYTSSRNGVKLLAKTRSFVFASQPQWRRLPLISSKSHTTTFDLNTTTTTTSASIEEEEEEEIIYKELKSLSATLRHADELYYSSNQSNEQNAILLSDEEYDAIARREETLCQIYPHLQKRLEEDVGLGVQTTRYGGRIGSLLELPRAPTHKQQKHTHLMPKMQSLDNAFTQSDISKWLERTTRKLLLLLDSNTHPQQQLEIIAEPKLDGLSLSLRYQLDQKSSSNSYKFQWGATRGDGTIGEDVTDTVQFVPNIPKCITLTNTKNITFPQYIEVRGEIIFSKAAFQRLQQTTPTFSNARNAASGILQRGRGTGTTVPSEQTKELCSFLNFFAYDITVASSDEEETATNTLWQTGTDLRLDLKRMGFLLPEPIRVFSTPLFLPSPHHSQEKKNTEQDGQIIQLVETTLSLVNYHKHVMEHTRYSFDFEMDGIVYKVNNVEQRNLCGSSTRAPRWAIAHKFPSSLEMTFLNDVQVQVGRTGAITPIAILEPIPFHTSGIVISKASLHNFEWASKILLLSDDEDTKFSIEVGTPVFISRAGDVIPQVVKRVPYDVTTTTSVDRNEHPKKLISLQPPKFCPSCGSPTAFDNEDSVLQLPTTTSLSTSDLTGKNESLNTSTSTNNTSDVSSSSKTPLGAKGAIHDSSGRTGLVLRCTGPQFLCKARAIGALVHAFSKGALDVSGLSEARITQLRDAGLLNRPCDIFALVTDENVSSTVSELPGWGYKSTSKLAATLNSTMKTGLPLDRFIYSLGIRHVGQFTSTLLASAFNDVDLFLDALTNVSNIDNNADDENAHRDFIQKFLVDVKGIGPVAFASLLSFSKDETQVKAAKDLAKIIPVKNYVRNKSALVSNELVSKPSSPSASLPLQNLTVVFTGAIPGYSRSQVQDIALSMGAKSTPGSISKSTSLVVEGEKGGSKVKKARDLGIRVIDSIEFLRILDEYKTTRQD